MSPVRTTRDESGDELGSSSALALFTDRLPEAYDELHGLAELVLFRRRGPRSVRTTSLVHETYLRLARHPEMQANGDEHLLAIAARAMRHVLVDRARRRTSIKAGGGMERVPFEHDALEARETLAARREAVELLGVDDALKKLGRLDARKAEVVELRFFGGLSIEETAAVLAVSPMTVKRDWAYAREWIQRELEAE